METAEPNCAVISPCIRCKEEKERKKKKKKKKKRKMRNKKKKMQQKLIRVPMCDGQWQRHQGHVAAKQSGATPSAHGRPSVSNPLCVGVCVSIITRFNVIRSHPSLWIIFPIVEATPHSTDCIIWRRNIGNYSVTWDILTIHYSAKRCRAEKWDSHWFTFLEMRTKIE